MCIAPGQGFRVVKMVITMGLTLPIFRQGVPLEIGIIAIWQVRKLRLREGK